MAVCLPGFLLISFFPHSTLFICKLAFGSQLSLVLHLYNHHHHWRHHHSICTAKHIYKKICMHNFILRLFARSVDCHKTKSYKRRIGWNYYYYYFSCCKFLTAGQWVPFSIYLYPLSVSSYQIFPVHLSSNLFHFLLLFLSCW